MRPPLGENPWVLLALKCALWLAGGVVFGWTLSYWAFRFRYGGPP